MNRFAVGFIYEHVQPYEKIELTKNGHLNYINKDSITVLSIELGSSNFFSIDKYVGVEIIEADTDLEAIKKLREKFPFHILQATAIEVDKSD